ncbi:hypothetical protein ACIBBE_24550 [Streptomyces sp. NPDC051644]|uniref:hypothetical protein n=1 Tax=Streptomyces sp. NPDC051644 TaxID=3365666 RepID=UPI00378870A9
MGDRVAKGGFLGFGCGLPQFGQHRQVHGVQEVPQCELAGPRTGVVGGALGAALRAPAHAPVAVEAGLGAVAAAPAVEGAAVGAVFPLRGGGDGCQGAGQFGEVAVFFHEVGGQELAVVAEYRGEGRPSQVCRRTRRAYASTWAPMSSGKEAGSSVVMSGALSGVVMVVSGRGAGVMAWRGQGG